VNITLIGMPGSGKSTVGVVLAKMRGMDFVDVDLVIQQREKQRLQEILDSQGMEAFLDAEEAATCSLARENTVIAPGGSVIARENSMAHLHRLGVVVYLHLPLDELTERLGNAESRGIAYKAGQTLADLYAERTPRYEAYADLMIDCAGHRQIAETAAAVSQAVDRWLEKRKA
jgi:shikimate kinase